MRVPSRVLSLLPGATEMIAALGCADLLVGRSHECDYPESIAHLPICSRPRIDPTAAGIDIHRGVAQLLEGALSVFELDVDLIRELEPDLVLTQAQCDVCAVSVEDVESALAKWTGARPRIMSLSPQRLGDVFADVERIAGALDVSARAKSLLSEWRSRLASVSAAASRRVEKPTVICLEWFEPLMVAGNWVPELVEIGGGRDAVGQAGAHSPWIEWSAIQQADPDVVILMPCGFNLERTVHEANVLTNLPGWKDLRAVKTGKLYAVDGSSYFNRPGPRLIESAEILASALWQDSTAEPGEAVRWVKLAAKR